MTTPNGTAQESCRRRLARTLLKETCPHGSMDGSMDRVAPSRHETSRTGQRLAWVPGAFALGFLVALPLSATANGFGESRAWQFMNPAERSARVATVDLIERKRGGFYDGFSVVNNNTTNIGVQMNCNNIADATANRSAQTQRANSPEVNNSAQLLSDAAGNVSDSAVGTGAQAGAGGPGSLSTAQDNSGTISSSVSESTTQSSSGPINSGTSSSAMSNDQLNSGVVQAGVDWSTACDMGGARIEGAVGGWVPGGPINGPLNGPSN